MAHFSSVRSRQYAASVPTIAVGAVTTNGVSAASLTLNPTSVVGGPNSQGTVTLSWPAPSGGATVTLTSSNTAAAQVPASVVVPAAATSATFTITTSAVSSPTSSTISASFGGTTPTAPLTVAHATPTLLSVALNPTNVLGGGSSQGTVTLSGPALGGGATVTLTSSNTATAQVPASVIVPAAASSATFTITTSAVNSSTSAVISASYNSSSQTATLAVAPVASSSAVLTYHNDNLRTGQNVNETILTTANVNSSTFGKLFSLPVDGPIFAQPLYLPGVTVGTQVHNLVFVATEHNSVYAWDADTVSTTPVWHDSFINQAGGVTAIPCAEAAGNDCSTITPEFGITSTPVIDSSTGTLYVVASTKEVSGGTTSYVYRLHALSVTTGQEKFGGPMVIQATSGSATLVPKQQLQRPGLLLVNGVVYIGFGSHGDTAPWYGWLLGYNASTLQRVMVFNTAPTTGEAAIWQSGCGPAADAGGNIYFNTGNGPFDANTGGLDYGDSIVKLNSSGTVVDYFTPYNQATLNASDADVGSSGLVLLPDQTGTYAHVLIGAGKQGVIYSVNRDNNLMGRYNSTSNQNIQSLAGLSSHGLFGSPAYWNGNVYFAAWDDYLRAFQVTNGMVALSSHSSITLAFPGATPSVSSNGSSNGIVWIIQENVPNDTVITNPPAAVLRAYDATNLANELYDSTEAAGNRDVAGGAVKFAVPTIANGKVYVGNSNQLTVYGLLH